MSSSAVVVSASSAATTSAPTPSPPCPSGVPMDGMGGSAICVENDLDKQCNALGTLFAQIVNEMKVRRGSIAGV